MADNREESTGFTIVKWGAALGLGWLISGYVMDAAKSLAVVGACVVLGTVFIESWPFVQFLIKEGVISLFKWRARANPIGSLQVVEQSKQEELSLYREETVAIDADTRAFERMVKEIERDYPDDPETANLQTQLKNLQDELEDRRANEVEFERALTNYRAGIKRMQVMFSASQVGARASKRANMSKQQYEKLVVSTAFDTVQKSMDMMSARLAASRSKAAAQRAALPPAAKRATIEVVTNQKDEAVVRRR